MNSDVSIKDPQVIEGGSSSKARWRRSIQRFPFWSWLWFILGALYFLLPLASTLIFSMQMQRGTLSFVAYEKAIADPEFVHSFLYSVQMAIITIIVSLVIIVPTAYWIRLRLSHLRPVIEFITLMPFVVPAIILVFGLIRVYGSPVKIPFTGINLLPPLTNTDFGTNILLIAGYMILGMPYMYRSVDAGLQAMDVRTLTEAGQSLGASWFSIMVRVIFPNLRTAILSGALLNFAIVVGEVILASYLGRPAFGPYLFLLGQHRAYEPAALSFISFLLTWAAMGIIMLLTGEQGQVSGGH
jgi:putative spermidine/putrescine transport system permease protein